MKTRAGFTLIEIMVGAIIFAMIIVSIYKLTMSGHKSAQQAMQGHQVNEEIQSAIDHFVKDVREANLIIDTSGSSAAQYPPLLQVNAPDSVEDALQAAINNHKTDDPCNRLLLVKCFPLPPNAAGSSASTRSTRKYLVEYTIEGEEGNPNKTLFRKFAQIEDDYPWTDLYNNPYPPLKGDTAFSKPLISEINITRDYFVFFRTVDSSGAIGARSIYLAAKLHRKEKKADGTLVDKELFQSKILVTAHFRGSAPN